MAYVDRARASGVVAPAVFVRGAPGPARCLAHARLARQVRTAHVCPRFPLGSAKAPVRALRCAAGRPARASLSPLASHPSSLLRPAARRIKRFIEAGIRMETTAVLEYLAGADERSDTATLYITSAAASEAAHAVSAEHAGELDGHFSRSEQTASKHTRLDHQRQTGRTSVMATTAAAGLLRAARTPSLRLTQVAIDQLPSFVSKSEVDQQPAHQSEGAIENWRIEVAQELEREKTKRVSVGESVAQAVQDVSELFRGSRESAVYLGSSSFWPSN